MEHFLKKKDCVWPIQMLENYSYDNDHSIECTEFFHFSDNKSSVSNNFIDENLLSISNEVYLQHFCSTYRTRFFRIFIYGKYLHHRKARDLFASNHSLKLDTKCIRIQIERYLSIEISVCIHWTDFARCKIWNNKIDTIPNHCYLVEF